jgi:hypothetical protein
VIPDGRALAIIVAGALDLRSRSSEAPNEVRRKGWLLVRYHSGKVRS